MVGTTLPTPMYALYAEQHALRGADHDGHLSRRTRAACCSRCWRSAGGPTRSAGGRCCWPARCSRWPAPRCSWSPTRCPMLLVGRVLSGLSAGIFTGTATAAVIEAAPPSWRDRAAAVATVANIGGLGTGPLLAGLLVAVRAAAAAPELRRAHRAGRAGRERRCWSSRRPPQRTGSIGVQRLSVPAEVRPVFVIAALAAFAGFAVTGLFTAVAPSFLSQVVGIDEPRGRRADRLLDLRRLGGGTGGRPNDESATRGRDRLRDPGCRDGDSGCGAALFVAGGADRRRGGRRRRPGHQLQPRPGRRRRAHPGRTAAPRSAPPTSSSRTWRSRCRSSARDSPPSGGDCRRPG